MIKKRLLMIGIAVLVCALVAVGILLVLKFDPLEDPISDNGIDDFLTIVDEKIRIYRFSPENVDYMEITNRHESYRIRMEGDQVFIVGYETIPLLKASSAGLFNSVSTLTLETVVDENCTDFSRFGLDTPSASITIQAYSDARVTFHIGDMSPTGEYYYLSVEGEKIVYLISESLAGRYLKSVEEYCDKKLYKTFVPLDDFTGLTIKSPTQNYSFRKVTAEEQAENFLYFSGIAMESPFDWGVDAAQIERVMQSMVLLTATDVVQMCVDEEDLAQYGLDPASRTEIVLSVYADPNPTMYNNSVNNYFDSSKPTGVYSDYTVTYWLGKTVDRQVYVMFEGRPVVYFISADAFPWLEWTPSRYCLKMLFGEYLTDLTGLSVVTPQQSFDFILSGMESGDVEDLRVSCGDIAVNPDDFTTFYSNILGIYPSGEASMPETGEPAVAEVRYTLKDGSSHSIGFYAVDERNCAANVDGQTFLSVRITEIQKILNDVQKLLNGQTVLS